VPYKLNWSLAAGVSGGSKSDQDAYSQVLQCLANSNSSLGAYVNIINLFLKNKSDDVNFPFLTEYARHLIYITEPQNEPALARSFTFDAAGQLLAYFDHVDDKCSALERHLKFAGSVGGKAKFAQLFKNGSPNLAEGATIVQDWAVFQKKYENGGPLDEQQQAIALIEFRIKNYFNNLVALLKKQPLYGAIFNMDFAKETLPIKNAFGEVVIYKVDLYNFLADSNVEQTYKFQFIDYLIDYMGSKILKKKNCSNPSNVVRVGNVYKQNGKKQPYQNSSDPVIMRNALRQLRTDLKFQKNFNSNISLPMTACASKNIVYSIEILSKAQEDMLSSLRTALALDDYVSTANEPFNLNSTISVAVETLLDSVVSMLKLTKVTLTPTQGKTIILEPHIFYELDDYNEMQNNKTIQQSDIFLPTTASSLNIPLYRITSDKLKVTLEFFNLSKQILDFFYLSADIFYFNDPAQGSIPSVSFYDEYGNAGEGDKWILRPKRKDANPKKAAPSMAEDREAWKEKYNIAYWLTDWSCDYSRTYVPLYALVGGSLRSHVIWRLSSGYNKGSSRADSVAPENYRWAFAGDLREIVNRLTERFDDGTDFSNLSVAHIAQFLGLRIDCAIFKTPVRRTATGLDSSANASQSLATIWANTKTIASFPARITWQEEVDDFRLKYIDVNGDSFIQCSTPFDSEAQQSDENSIDTLKGSNLLATFRFYYFRRSLSINWFRVKIRKEEVQDATNRPRSSDVEPDQILKNADGASVAYGVNLPIVMDGNYAKFDKFKKQLAVIKNKESPLLSSRSPRLTASRVMSPISAYAVDGLNLRPRSLSATDLAVALMSRTTDAQGNTDMKIDSSTNNQQVSSVFAQAWRRLKSTRLDFLPTDQEWCHLMGHGDNGGERIGNFVGGSKHCNTEQLAIELAQRGVTQQTRNAMVYSLKSTAYLIPDNSMKIINGTTYLELDRDYIRNAYLSNLEAAAQVTNAKADDKGNATDPNTIEEDKGNANDPNQMVDENSNTVNQNQMIIEKGDLVQSDRDALQSVDDGKYIQELNKAGVNAPVAAFVRYKINKKVDSASASTSSAKVKLLDHVFEGQSEFIDRNQFSILFRTVQYMIDPDTFLAELRASYLQPLEVKAN
jgi:hypothetical protein